ncbi:uncharacterized protein LOC116771435 isoform X1 [Danaus plexippus]|uniref:uncharacterized protein LOC116771435 isoform X1 n=1 Tax=Danaus plexippus TaxID=13037 RepID=UPI002AB07A35|nr:uncharacterized protein LOC116771435 isoform X1 [Danaus plexippus]
MDKETYETYEYLEADSGDNDTSEFFVVQGDGTFLSVDRPIQYVRQVESAKDNLDESQSCAVYDVTPQQFYVDVDESSELISVSDQFILPGGDNNPYSNSFLLQSASNSKEDHVEQMDEDTIEDTKEDVASTTLSEGGSNKANGDCTEITLSDEQYQLLKRKGWILLEINDKVFLLDTLGLHDITADEKLIQKLKNEIDDDNSEDINQNPVKIEETSYIEPKYEMTEGDENNEEETLHFIVEGDQIIADGNSQEVSEYSENDHEILQVETIEEEQDEAIRVEHDYVQLNSVKDTKCKRENDVLRLKTKFSFRDIPSEIVLGKTTTGKKLVARVVKTEAPVDPKQANLKLAQQNGQQQCTTTLEEFKFENLIQQALRGYDTCSVKDISAAETVVEQLLRVPEFKPAIIERRLMITKVVILQDTSGNVFKEGRATLVTGRAVLEGTRGWRFMFLPTMLPRLLGEEDDDDDELQERSEELDDDIFLHIHIRETKDSDGITRISITLNKRHIPIKTMTEMKSRYPKTAFACSACAAVYKTEEGLRLHQETECMETETPLTIDADDTSDLYSVIGTVKEKQYICNQCHLVFNKLNNCQRHVKLHYKQDPENSRQEVPKKTEGAYKCKMCPSTYHHAATLSKHIVSKHIKIRST